MSVRGFEEIHDPVITSDLWKMAVAVRVESWEDTLAKGDLSKNDGRPIVVAFIGGTSFMVLSPPTDEEIQSFLAKKDEIGEAFSIGLIHDRNAALLSLRAWDMIRLPSHVATRHEKHHDQLINQIERRLFELKIAKQRREPDELGKALDHLMQALDHLQRIPDSR